MLIDQFIAKEIFIVQFYLRVTIVKEAIKSWKLQNRNVI